jgi:hypothetical protein
MTNEVEPVGQYKAMEVNGSVEIGMNDLICVGIARIEKKIKISISDLKEVIKKENEMISKLGEEFKITTKDATPIDMIKDGIAIETVFSKLSSVSKNDLIVTTTTEFMAHNNTNLCRISVASENKSKMTISSRTFDLTSAQKEIIEKIDLCKEEISLAEEKIINLKRKLSDFPTLERQLKARIVESQLSQSDVGRELLDATIDKIEADFNFIG